MEHRAPQWQVRVAGRLANEFLLGIIKIGGFGREVIDGLLIVAISQANIALINRSTELQLAYATLDSAPADDLRRPASMNAIAASLHIPFETARRRIRSLAEMGVLQITSRGVILPQGPVQSPFYRMVATGQYEMVRKLYHRLCDIGAVPDLPRAPSRFDPAAPPIRLVIRLASDYALRLAEPVTRHIGDVVSGVILMDIIQANTERMGDMTGGSEADGAEGFVPDAQRTPIRQSLLGERLGMPHETVRRHLSRLAVRDLVEQVSEGYIVPARILARPEFAGYLQANQTHLNRFLAGLADFGVLALWDAERAQVRGAA